MELGVGRVTVMVGWRVGARMWSVGSTARRKRRAASAGTVDVDVAGTGIDDTGSRDTGSHERVN
jgi:hypothetical protein